MRVHLAQVPARLRDAALPPAALLPTERARVDRAAPADRSAVATSLLLARTAAAAACGLPVEDVRVDRRCPRCGATTHGVPRVRRRDDGPVPFLSLSRCADLVLVAMSTIGPLGVDLERADADPGAATARVALAPGEPPADGHDPLRTWVRKEAVLKAAGTGLAVDPRTLRVSDAAGGPVVGGAAPRPPDGTRWWLVDLDLGPTHRRTHLGALAAAVPPGPVPAVELVTSRRVAVSG